jgi:BlaI family transcriptional regulator, penicillinase repressor
MKTPGFSRLQLRIMQVLWERKHVTAREITDELCKMEPIAHSTVQTLLRRLEQRGAVAHEVENNTFVFSPLVANKKVVKNSVQDLIDRLFNGSAQGMVSYLVSNRYVTSEELKDLSEMPEKRGRNKS